MKHQIITTESGEELVVLTRRDFDALRARAGDEDAEDIMTERIITEARQALAEGREVVLPDEFTQAIVKGKGNVLRGLREHRGLSQAQVARAAGITQGYYSEIEARKKAPTADVLDRISDALGLDRKYMRALERNRVTGA